MKNLFFNLCGLLALLLTATTLYAQTPQKFSYQGVIRNAEGEIIDNKIIRNRISILQGSIDGTSIYVETHTPMTNENGLFTIEIGGGTVEFGSFTDIDWASGPFFIKTETDPTGGSDYTISGTNQLLSVPYALYAETAGNSEEGPQGPEGPEGPEGRSAYQVWLDAGNTGTEEDFLNSFIGPAGPEGGEGADGISAYQIWLDAGNTGTEADFLNSLAGPEGPEGPQGIEGKSAYQVWLDAGNTGTEADFIMTLNGADGAIGKSAYQIWLESGNSGTEADFIASLEGPAGPEGSLPQRTIGEVYGGGIVFYVYDNGQHGLIVSTVDVSAGALWSEDNVNTRAKGSGVGAGFMNTTILIAVTQPSNSDDFAAALCNEYWVTLSGVNYRDWYLPSKHELDLLYQQKTIIGSPTGSYWSSTESTDVQAWKQIFDDGNQVSSSKDASNKVRAIRKF